jgi:hypothetical protein
MVIGIVNLILIVGGFALGIVALCGVKRYGAAGIVAPAIVGLAINLLFIAGIGMYLVSARRLIPAPPTAAARALAARNITPFSSPQSALRQTGWLGVSRTNGTVLSLIAMDDAHADTRAERAALAKDASIIVIVIDNRGGKTPAVLDTRNAQLVFSDGRVVAALDTAAVAPPGEAASMAPPFRVEAGGLFEGKILFIPPDLDLTKLKSIRATLSGSRIQIDGRIFTAAEKTQAIQVGQRAQP